MNWRTCISRPTELRPTIEWIINKLVYISNIVQCKRTHPDDWYQTSQHDSRIYREEFVRHLRELPLWGVHLRVGLGWEKWNSRRNEREYALGEAPTYSSLSILFAFTYSVLQTQRRDTALNKVDSAKLSVQPRVWSTTIIRVIII